MRLVTSPMEPGVVTAIEIAEEEIRSGSLRLMRPRTRRLEFKAESSRDSALSKLLDHLNI